MRTVSAAAAFVFLVGALVLGEQQPAGREDQWALIVGISDYPGQIQKLQFARNDSVAIKELLVSAAGFREDHIRLLTDDGKGEAKATKQNILAAVDHLAPRVQPGHQLIVFLAGHGIARGLGAEAKGYFMPADVDAQSKESLERTAIDLEELSGKLAALKASQFTLFVDACRDDPFPGRGIKGNTMTDVMVRGMRVGVGKSRPGGVEPPTQVLFYSCQIGERAYEDAKLEHGVFTYYILRGIRELASPPDGRVDAGLLAAYLRDNVRNWSEEFKRRARFAAEQNPTMVAIQVRGPLTIVRVSPVAGSVPASPARGAVLLSTSPEGALLSIDGERLGQGPLKKELAPGEHVVRAELSDFEPAEARFSVLAGYEQEVSLALKPSKASASYERGGELEAQGLLAQAISSYEMAIREDPAFIAAYHRLASAYQKGARLRDAVDLLGGAVRRFPDNVAFLARYSRALSAWAQADEKQDMSINQRPEKPLKQKDARKEAVRSGELATQKAAGAADAHLAVGYAYLLEERDRSKALASFARASALAPEDAEGYFAVGHTYRLLKQYQQAIPQLKKAIELRPDYYDAHRELAYCHHATGDTDQAIAEYQQASGYRQQTSDSGEMAANNLALSALYTEKGQQVGGAEGEQMTQAGRGYETDAREMDPTLEAAAKVLNEAGLTSRIENHLPPEVRKYLRSSPLPGNIKLPWPRRP